MKPFVPGEIHGWLTVLGEGSRDGNNRRMVHVRCRCGREYDAWPSVLKGDDPKCRWCSNKIKAHLKTMDLVGKSIGVWDVLEQSSQMSGGGHLYICRCRNCGHISARKQYEILHNTGKRCAKCEADYDFQVDGSVAVGTLPSGDQFIIDAEDIPRVSKHRWYKKADQNYILSDTKENGKLIRRMRLHRFLMGLEDDDERVIDHINRNPMDCQKANMRIVTQSQNCLNRSIRRDNSTGFIGVQKSAGKYAARIWIAKNAIELTRCDDRILCAQMYNHAARLLYGEFVGELNDVPEASPEVKRLVEETCAPYMDIAAEVTAPVDDGAATKENAA